MPNQDPTFPVYIETGAKKVFASAVDWPGLARSGRDETAALQALLAYAPRCGVVYAAGGVTGFALPTSLADLRIEERLPGSTTTDFGAPDAVPAVDIPPLTGPDLDRHSAILRSCWAAFHRAIQAGQGRELRVGPRGGGRSLDAILSHTIEAHQAYLGRLGWGEKLPPTPGHFEALHWLEQASHQALQAAAAGQIAPFGPRGGARWTARWFVRRAAWHILDHIFEMEDRLV